MRKNSEAAFHKLVAVDLSEYESGATAWDIYLSNYGNNLSRVNNDHLKNISEWMRALPSILSMPFTDYAITEWLDNNVGGGGNYNTKVQDIRYWNNAARAFIERYAPKSEQVFNLLD